MDNAMDKKVLSTHILHFHKNNLAVLAISRFTFCKVDYFEYSGLPVVEIAVHIDLKLFNNKNER